MKTKILTFVLLLTTFTGFAQVDSMEQVIAELPETDQTLRDKYRSYVLECLNTNNRADLIRILDYGTPTDNLFHEDICLSHEEYILCCIWAGCYDRVLRAIDDNFFTDFIWLEYQSINLETNLYAFFEPRMDSIFAIVESADLPAVDKEMLQLLLEYISEFVIDNQHADYSEFISHARFFMKQYPGADYTKVIQDVLAKANMKRTQIDLSWVLNTGWNDIMGGYNQYFAGGPRLGMNLDIGRKRFFLYTAYSCGFGKTKDPLEHDETEWSEGEEAGDLLGYVALATNLSNLPRFRLAPYYGIGGCYMFNEQNPSYPAIGIGVSHVMGLNIDVRFFSSFAPPYVSTSRNNSMAWSRYLFDYGKHSFFRYTHISRGLKEFALRIRGGYLLPYSGHKVLINHKPIAGSMLFLEMGFVGTFSM